MNKSIFILPYFGKFNNYFQLFLNSCRENPDYDWIIFTDDHSTFIYPDNVRIIYIEFDELRKTIENKFKNLKVSIETPYKFCDLKPMYGYIFENYIEGYEYWGHCDNDLIFGKISDFLNFEIIQQFDKIGFLGHMSLYKNNKEMREIFKSTDKYKEVLQSSKPFKFDEEFTDSINNICIKQNKKIYIKDNYADIYVKSSNFKITHYNFDTNKYITEKKDNSLFIWDNGKLYKYVIDNKKLVKKEYMYIHLQKRKMKVNNTNQKIYKIIPNAFEDLEDMVNINNYRKIIKKNFNLHYFEIRFKNLKTKIKNRIGE